MLPPARLLAAALGFSSACLAATAPWRPFSGDSPWNQPIAANAPTDADSRAMIDDFAARGPLHVNIRTWSIPVYFVDADATPKHDVGDSRPGIYGAGFEFPRRIPIPDDAIASPPVSDDSDNHLCIVDRAKHLEWGMWAARRDAAGRWFTGLGAVTDLAGTGVAPPWFAASRELDSHRARAGGFPLIAGLMLVDEIKAGRISHALVFAYDHCRTGVFVPPASTAQVSVPGTANSRGIPMGGRIQLDPSWDVEHSGLSATGKIIARALQEYGAFCGDYAGANVIYGENSPAAVKAWEGLLSSAELEAVFTPAMIRRYFRVVDMGNILPGQNFELPPPYVIAVRAAGETAPARIDPLAHTITLHLPPAVPAAPHTTKAGGAAHVESPRTTLTWTLHPRATIPALALSSDPSGKCHIMYDTSGASSGAEIELAPAGTTPLLLTAPDGRVNTWQIVVADASPAPSAPPRRFFSADSFWNQPISPDAEIDPRTPRWIKLLESEPTGENFLVNSQQWTIPLYEVTAATPRQKIGLLAITPQEKTRWHTERDFFGHGAGFDRVPLPPEARPDPQADSHLAVVDWEQNLVWDMWALSRNSDGTWKSATGMVYAADGPGVFSTAELGVQDGESVHFHGPSRAAGVPAVAGLILYDEVAAGEIRHKIAAASRFCAYKEFVFPAAWTDGFTEGGIPEGTVIQLDPALDLSAFTLTREERIVCVALQRYGMVLVDIAQGQPVYAEGLWGHPGKSWDGKLPHGTGGISKIPYRHFRMLKAGPATHHGDGRSKFAPVWENP